jgi:hypothetical protein
MSTITLVLWEDRSDPDRVMMLYEGQVPATESPSTNQRWKPYFTFVAYNPLVTPYPPGTELFRARHSTIYPYALLDIVPMLDVYNVDDPGTYFVAYRTPRPNTVKLPFKDAFIFVEQGKKLL